MRFVTVYFQSSNKLELFLIHKKHFWNNINHIFPLSDYSQNIAKTKFYPIIKHFDYLLYLKSLKLQ